MKILYFIPIAALLLFVLNFSGCPGSNKTYTLRGTEWKLDTLNGKAVTLKDSKYITLNFEGSTGKLNGTAVCNKYSGEYSKKEDSLRFSGIVSTKIMCDDNLNESDYFNSLGSVDRYKISGGKLRLLSKDSVAAIFKQ